MPSIRSRATPTGAAVAFVACVALTWAAGARDASAQVRKPARRPAAGPAPAATPVERLKGLKGFRVELLYTVPREEQGSWVSLAVDPKGRLIASGQYGKLYRVTPPPI